MIWAWIYLRSPHIQPQKFKTTRFLTLFWGCISVLDATRQEPSIRMRSTSARKRFMFHKEGMSSYASRRQNVLWFGSKALSEVPDIRHFRAGPLIRLSIGWVSCKKVIVDTRRRTQSSPIKRVSIQERVGTYACSSPEVWLLRFRMNQSNTVWNSSDTTMERKEESCVGTGNSLPVVRWGCNK